MKLSLQDLRRIAAEVVAEEELAIDVVGATHLEGDPAYAEIIFALGEASADTDTNHLVVGLDRDTSEQACRDHIQAQLRRLLQADDAVARQ
jgi:hypothetical protein